MNITDLRDWATATHGAYSHKEGQLLAALASLEEALGQLAKQGVALELSFHGFAPQPSPSVKAAPEAPLVTIPISIWPTTSPPEAPSLEPSTFVDPLSAQPAPQPQENPQ